MPRIALTTEVKAKRSIVFDLSRSIDLHTISTRHTDERAIGGRTSGLIEFGETVTWRARHFGIYQRLTSRITEFQRPDVFVDEMVSGAFHSFRHEHRFVEGTVQGHTIILEIFDYRSPLGIIGRLADVLFLKAYMTRLLTERNRVIKLYAESEKWREVLRHG